MAHDGADQADDDLRAGGGLELQVVDGAGERVELAGDEQPHHVLDVPTWRYTVARFTPSSRATSCTDVRPIPCRAKQRAAASRYGSSSAGGAGGNPASNTGSGSTSAITQP